MPGEISQSRVQTICLVLITTAIVTFHDPGKQTPDPLKKGSGVVDTLWIDLSD